ncbi:MAG: hypothetical protein HN443_01695 [Flavobacteriaceae bacterium]|jgi:hypothetical protein|nr:hypothetical protein [Flavobacteriaceae bacterium]
MKTYLSCLMVFLLWACNKKNTEPLSDLELNKIKWEALAIDSYTYTFQITCFCLIEATLPKSVEVSNGKIITVNKVAYDSEAHWGVMTIPQLFDRIEQAEENNSFVTEVSYHPEKGYPTSLYIDEEEMMADEEMGYMISDLSY